MLDVDDTLTCSVRSVEVCVRLELAKPMTVGVLRSFVLAAFVLVLLAMYWFRLSWCWALVPLPLVGLALFLAEPLVDWFNRRRLLSRFDQLLCVALAQGIRHDDAGAVLGVWNLAGKGTEQALHQLAHEAQDVRVKRAAEDGLARCLAADRAAGDDIAAALRRNFSP